MTRISSKRVYSLIVIVFVILGLTVIGIKIASEFVAIPNIDLNRSVQLTVVQLHNNQLTLQIINLSKNEIWFPEDYNLQIFTIAGNEFIPFTGSVNINSDGENKDQILEPASSTVTSRTFVIEFESNPYELVPNGKIAFSVLGFINSNSNQPAQATAYFPND